MKKIILLLLLLLITINVYSTSQIPNTIKYKGKNYALKGGVLEYDNPLEIFFKNNPDKKLQNIETSTMLWRGYVAIFEIINDQLFLKDIKTMNLKNKKINWESVMNEVFPNQDSVKVGWYSGVLVLPYGKYSYGKYSKYRVLEIDAGRLTKAKKFKAKKYEKFKDKQFIAFKKTEKYEELAKNSNIKDKEEFDIYIRLFIMEKLEKILSY